MVAALHVTEAPADIPAAIRAAKAELRTRIGDYQGVFAEVEAAMRREVAEIVALRERGEEVWPVVQFADVAAGALRGRLAGPPRPGRPQPGWAPPARAPGVVTRA
jgi:hypothetical protein